MLTSIWGGQLMTILDNDLTNAIQAERQLVSAHERLVRELVRTPRDPSPTFSHSRTFHAGSAWLRARLVGPLSVRSSFGAVFANLAPTKQGH
jgi:hypothetical protein